MSALNTLATAIADHLAATDKELSASYEASLETVSKIDDDIKAEKAKFEEGQTSTNAEHDATEVSTLNTNIEDYITEVNFYIENESEAKDSLAEIQAEFVEDIASLTDTKNAEGAKLDKRRSDFEDNFGSTDDFNLEVNFDYDAPVWGDEA